MVVFADILEVEGELALARMVVIADDLTGAADSAASSAALGCKAAVVLYSPQHRDSELPWLDADILAIDANSRCLCSEEASQRTAHLVTLCESQNRNAGEYTLFKKIDSTLRGNIAYELAAVLHARRANTPSTSRISILMAPALPAQGRTTVDGRLLVHGVPLEQTDIWKTEARPAESNIARLLAVAGLSCGLIDLQTVRSDSAEIGRAIVNSAEHVDVVVCDAETEDDLHAIAEASSNEPAITALAGSAGLASQVGRTMSIGRDLEPYRSGFASGSTLFVIGTTASLSREQARILETMPNVSTFHATPAAIHNSSAIATQIIQSLQAHRDVLLVFDGAENCSKLEEQRLWDALVNLASRCAPYLGGLVASGGETAREVLDALGIRQLHLLGEVEAGLPFSVAGCWDRPLPVITKAGAFGSPQALVHCINFLRQLKRMPVKVHPADPSLHYKS